MKKVWTYLVIAMVALVASVNYELFIFPNQFAPSGVNGICTMLASPYMKLFRRYIKKYCCPLKLRHSRMRICMDM